MTKPAGINRALTVRLAVASAFVLACVVVGRVWVEGQSEMRKASAALDSNDRAAAQKHLLYAARWYLPFSSTTPDAVEMLLAIGQSWLYEGDWERAVSCYDDARGALYATAWLPGPDKELLARADDGYARALAGWKKAEMPEVDLESETRRYNALAAGVETVSPWWSLVMGLSFLAYAGLLVMGALRWERPGFSRLRWVGATVACFGLWILSMFFV